MKDKLCVTDRRLQLLEHLAVNKFATRIIYMDPIGLVSYNGDYDYYISKAKVTENTEEKKAAIPVVNDYQEQKRIAAQKRKAINRHKKVEELIFETEDKIEKKNAELIMPEIATDYVKATEITNDLAELEKALEALYVEWEELEEAVSKY